MRDFPHFPIEATISSGIPIAMFDYQRVDQLHLHFGCIQTPMKRQLATSAHSCRKCSTKLLGLMDAGADV